MQSIDSKTVSKNIQINFKTRTLDILSWIHDNILDYPLIEDKPHIPNLRRQIEENRKTYRIFSPPYNQQH